MADYATGRQRNIQFSVKFDTTNVIKTALGVPPTGGYSRYAKCSFNLWTKIGNTIPYGARLEFSTGSTNDSGMVMTVYDGFGGSDSQDTRAAVAGPTRDHTDRFYGVVTIDATVEEYMQILESTSVVMVGIDSYGFPSHGGTARKDNLFARTIQFSERFKIGTNVTITCTCDSKTATSTHVVGVGEDIELDYRFGITDYSGFGGPFCTGADSWLRFYSLSYIDFVGANYSASTADGSIYYTESGTSVVFGAECPSLGDGVNNSVSLDFSLRPCDRYKLIGRLRAVSDAYPSNLNVTWRSSNGTDETVNLSPTCSEIRSQKQYRFYGEINGAPQPVSEADERSENWAYLNATSLSDAGEDTRDWRLGFLGRKYDTFDLTQANPSTVNDGSATTGWSNVSNTTISTSGGAIQIAVSGGTGECKLTL